MTIKKNTSSKRFWIVGIVLGFFVLFFVTFILFNQERSSSEKVLLETVNYVKVQCGTYTHYNEASESQGLLRAIENTRQVSYLLDEDINDGETLDEDLLSDYANKLWLNGILVLDGNGDLICSYYEDSSVQEILVDYVKQDVILNWNDYKERTYSTRITLNDNSYIDMAACARDDTDGVVVAYFYTSAKYVKDYTLTLQTLLSGYNTTTDGTIIIADNGIIIASNDDSLIGQETSNNEIIQTLKDVKDSKHISHIASSNCYGVMLKQRDHYIYAYVPDTTVFKNLPATLLIYVFVYAFILIMVWAIMQRSNRAYEEEYKEELKQAAYKADSANRAKTEFLQRMSHDIRTPINGICGMVEMSEHYNDDLEKRNDCRTKVKEASNLLLELVNEVLDMGKLESGEFVLEEKSFNLKNVFDEVDVVIEKLAQERNIKLIVGDMDVKHWNLIGSPIHVKRLFMNIMSNAVKYNKDNGTITISCVELESNKKDTTTIKFICKDTGIGMSKEYQEKIFEPFSQEDSTYQSKYAGSGLGMPIAKGLAEKMGGSLTFESELNVGTTFYATIPFKIDTNVNEENKTLAKTYSISGKNILLAEDNELNMEIAEFILTNAGANVLKANNGKQAVELVEKHKDSIDVILMDVMMPVMDGLEATKLIRTQGIRTPIIAMTANAFVEDKMKTKEAGMDDYVSKPLNSSLLIETIGRLLENKID